MFSSMHYKVNTFINRYFITKMFFYFRNQIISVYCNKLHSKLKTLKLIQTTLLIIVGFATLFMSAAILFDFFNIRESQGDYVQFVVIANFVCAFLYLAAVSSNLKGNTKNSARFLGLATLIMVVAFVALLFYIESGKPYELKTIKAITVRTAFTALMAIISVYILKQQ